MNKLGSIVIALGMCSTMLACNSTDQTTGNDAGGKELHGYTNQADVTTEDANFMDKAALGGMMEVDLGKIALQSSNARVKAFAALMVSDHSKTNNELKTLAHKHGIILPGGYYPDQKEDMAKLKSMTGADFDKHYMDMMVTDHSETIELFETGSHSLSNEVTKFAEETLPVLDSHYKMAKDIQSSLK